MKMAPFIHVARYRDRRHTPLVESVNPGLYMYSGLDGASVKCVMESSLKNNFDVERIVLLFKNISMKKILSVLLNHNHFA